MNLIEADAKAILRKHGLAISQGVMLDEKSELPTWARQHRSVLKAQLFEGGRGKAGLVRSCSPEDVIDHLASIRSALKSKGYPPHVLVDEHIDIRREFYLAVQIDDVEQCIVILFSPTGGVEVENGAALFSFRVPPGLAVRPDHLAEFFRASGVAPTELGPLCRYAAALCKVFVAEDAQLLEINPLALTSGGALIALDTKAVLDDDAAFRHADQQQWLSSSMRTAGMSALELKAAQNRITFVPLDGDVALLTGGAGNGMMVFDALSDAGYRPANFVDTIGGSGADRWQSLVELVFEHARQEHVRAIVAYFTLSVTPLRNLIDGLLAVLREGPPPKPLVIGVVATGAAETILNLQDAQALLRDAGLDAVVELPDLVERLKQTIPAR